jgi:predicted TIM-barrel fold metal-dependent hydrolase
MKIIIDVHAHIFNAKDIPLKGYLLSRKYDGILKHFAKPLIPILASYIRRKLEPDKKNAGIQNALGSSALALACLFLGKEYKRWAETLSKEVVDIVAEMVTTFQKDRIDLYVPLMIDYEYWFKNTIDNPISDQFKLIYENIILPYRGTIHPFVAFDPARELVFRKGLKNLEGEPERCSSLSLVKDAIENKAFLGVKLYNALGYRPFNNKLVEEQRKRIAYHKDKYVFSGEEYDGVLSELYDYCIENEVPIITHCGMDGIESYKDASFDFGRAILWRDVLKQERYKNLRVDLAHFGWNKKQGHQGNRSWVQEICEMLGEFDNLYTDVSHHEVVVSKDLPKFKSAYQQLCHDFPVLKERLLFGIDWHVIKRVANFENFKDRYIEVLKNESLFSDDEIDAFLGGNALKFLGLLPGGKNRERLSQFYQTQSIDPPAWFKAKSK